MVNLEENLKKKPYICPVMDVERFDFADVIVTSGTQEGTSPDGAGDPLTGGEGTGNEFNTP